MGDAHQADDLMGIGHEDPDPGTTWTWFLAGSVIFAALGIGVAALYYDMTGRWIDEIRVEPPVSAVEQLNAAQYERLTGPARRELRADAPEGALVIPIDAAMELTLEEFAGS